MKLTIGALCGLAVLCCLASATKHDGPDKIVRLEHSPIGFWTKKLAWKPRWVKSWQAKTVYVAHWKKTWGPVISKEWVPIPKPPPGWTKPAHKPVDHVHHHHKIPVHGPVAPLKTYAPAHAHAHVDLLPHHHHHHHAPIIHAHKPIDLVHPAEGLHFHADPGAHYGPAFHHHHGLHHHHEVAAHPHHHHHEHLEQPLAHHHHHEPRAESFHPHFLPLSTELLKIK